MDLSDKLIDLRITLTHVCDGFSLEEGNKSALLSTRIKILYILSERDVTPSELISKLCIAKSNLANILKVMINDGIVISYKNDNNSKNIYYSITTLGVEELDKYKEKMMSQFRSQCSGSEEQLTKKIGDIINILKGKKHD